MAEAGTFQSESAAAGNFDDGAVWTLGESGIWLGMGGLLLGVGYPHREGSFSDESASPGSWESE